MSGVRMVPRVATRMRIGTKLISGGHHKVEEAQCNASSIELSQVIIFYEIVQIIRFARAPNLSGDRDGFYRKAGANWGDSEPTVSQLGSN